MTRLKFAFPVARCTFALVVGALFITSPLRAQDPVADAPAAAPERTPSDAESLPALPVEVSFAFANGYIWRGIDFHANNAIQENRAPGENTGAWSFQPSVTVQTPLEGLSVNFWFGFALENRADRDVDQLWNNGTGTKLKPSEFLAALSNPAPYGLNDSAAGTYYLVSNETAPNAFFSGVAPTLGFDREPFGLDRLDEMDLTLAYSAQTARGVFGTGIASYNLIDKRSKNVPLVELFVFYTAPLPLAPTLRIANDLRTNALFASLGASHSASLAENVSVNVSAELGYANGPSLAASTGETHNLFTHVQGAIGLSFFGFNVTLNGVYRPDLRWVDADAGANEAAWIVGASNNRDGLQTDYARTNGFANAYINEQIATALNANGNPLGLTYEYTPRTRIPRVVWWLSCGYTVIL